MPRSEATEQYPGAAQWLEFNETCLQAEAALEDAKRAAARERDQVLNSIAAWTEPASNRVKAVINALYEEKVTAARTKCDNECKHAEQALRQKLG